MSKLAQILGEQSSGSRQVSVLVSFLCWSLYKTNRFHVAMGLFSNISQKTSMQNAQWHHINISDTRVCSSCGTSLLLPHFDIIRDLLLNRPMATWNLLIILWNFSPKQPLRACHVTSVRLQQSECSSLKQASALVDSTVRSNFAQWLQSSMSGSLTSWVVFLLLVSTVSPIKG